MEYKYDVFISYSRRDFVDDDKNIIPGNPISAITDAFDKNDITYWIDREGIKSGQQFRDEIIDAIAKSKVFLFVSSVNSNESPWTKKEILEAADSGKYIIPFRIDDCEYDRSVKFELRPLDFIEYYSDKEGAIEKLLSSVNGYKKEIAEKEKKKQLESQKAEIKAKIKLLEDDYRLSADRHEVALKEIQDLYAKLGITTKECPVCDKKVSIGDTFCERCGWQFPSLMSSEVDRKRLNIIKANWKILQAATASKDNIKALENENQELKESLDSLSKDLDKSRNEQQRLVAQCAELEDRNRRNRLVVDDLIAKKKALEEKIAGIEEKNQSMKEQMSDYRLRQKENLLKQLTQSSSMEIAAIVARASSRGVFLSDNATAVNLAQLISIMKNDFDLTLSLSDFEHCRKVQDVINAIIHKARIELEHLRSM